MHRLRATRAPMFGVALTCLAVSFLVFTSVANAVDPDPPEAHRDWVTRFGVRAGGVGGGYGDFLHKGTAWDMGLFKQRGTRRYGLGLTFGTLGMKPPYDHEPEWAHFEIFASAEQVFRNNTGVRPYLQGRVAVVRSHPRSELFLKKPIEELDHGESPTDAVNGFGLTFAPGIEFDVAPHFAVDLSAYLNWYTTKKYNMAPIGKPDTGDGVEWGGKIGATWHPLSLERPVMASALPDTTPLPHATSLRDAWGVTRSWGWASAEVLAINFGASMFNEYVRQANFNQVSPRSFWANLEEGFTYDDNKFKTNQQVHPFNGAAYFNAGRSNGLGYWASSICAMSGAFIWEVAGETHPMAYNDMISTGFGGMAYGEASYRISSRILDNTSTGAGRTWREIGAFLVDPIHGFNRFVSGRASRVQGNPSDIYDRRPPHCNDFVAAGVRIIGKGESIQDSTETQAVIDVYTNYGSPWDNDRRRPFDHFDLGIQLNGSDKVPLGRLQIRGDLFSKAFGGPTGKKHAIAFEQYFDYVDNNAYEFGGQSFGAALYSRFRPSATWGITTRLDLMAMILGAVDSEYAFRTVTPEQERLREYDYGPGAGVSFEAAVQRRGRRLFLIWYRANWINVKDGSVYVPAGNPGFDANHFVQALFAKVNIPIRSGMSLGLDSGVFLRESYFADPNLKDQTKRIPQARMYLSWEVGS